VFTNTPAPESWFNGVLGSNPPGNLLAQHEIHVFGFPRFFRIESPRISM
jgi:hypothetical protein